MSKQSKAKEKQGFLKKSPNCSNCINFSLEKKQYKTQWSSQEFTREFNLRCKIGVISGVAINEYKKEAIILYENGMKTYALPNEEVEIL